MIRTYANTKAELNIAQLRLNELMTEKEVIYSRYFPMTADPSKESSHTNNHSDPMGDYVAEITRIREETGMSLEGEIEYQKKRVDDLRHCINLMDDYLRVTTGIENELFRLIVVDGRKKTKAVELVAEKYNREPVTIWKYHYPKISKEIDKCIVNV